MLLFSLLLPLPLQTILLSLRAAHRLPLRPLSTLKAINSAAFSGSVSLKITASCSEGIIHQPNGQLPPRGLTQSFGTHAGRSLWLHSQWSMENAVHREQNQHRLEFSIPASMGMHRHKHAYACSYEQLHSLKSQEKARRRAQK